MAFRKWVHEQVIREDGLGELTRKLCRDVTWDGTMKSAKGKEYYSDMLVQEFRKGEKCKKNHRSKGPYRIVGEGFDHTFQTKKEMTEFYRGIKTEGELEGEDKKAALALFGLKEPCKVEVTQLNSGWCFCCDGVHYSMNEVIRSF